MGAGPWMGRFIVVNHSIANFAVWAAAPGVAKLSGDFNGDGRTDIALTGLAGWNTLPVAFSDGFGNFDVTNFTISGAGYPIPTGPQTFADWAATPGVVKLAGDFNGDGRTDIALAGACFMQQAWYPPWPYPYNGCAVPVAFSNGNGSFSVTSKSDDVSGCWPLCSAFLNFRIDDFGRFSASPGKTVLTGDFNADGRTDLALAPGPEGYLVPFDESKGVLPVALSKGDGFFVGIDGHSAQLLGFLEAPGAVCVTGDFNGDGSTDVAITGFAGSSLIPVAFSDFLGSWDVTYYEAGDFGGWAALPGVAKLSGKSASTAN
jgi:hypothetical protein